MSNDGVRAPLYRDPIYDGCADPAVVYNQEEKNWWLFYTQRRACVKVAGVAGSFGTAIGIAVSEDRGSTWIYRGICNGLELDWGQNTYWAPEVFFDQHAKVYRMLVTYVRGVPSRFGVPVGKFGIANFVSSNLHDWKFVNFLLHRSQADIIDACAMELLSGGYRIWYRDTEKNCAVYYTDTLDFNEYAEPRKAIEGKTEGPNVFRLGGYYWLIADPLGKRAGFTVHRSLDMEQWEFTGKLLDQPGKRFLDDSPGRHGDVVTVGDEAYIFYFTQPYKNYAKARDYDALQAEAEICVAQCAKIICLDGKLVCHRNEAFTLDLGEKYEYIDDRL